MFDPSGHMPWVNQYFLIDLVCPKTSAMFGHLDRVLGIKGLLLS